MKKTGEILKKAREAKGLTLHEIGLSLKINSKILKAIEDGDESHLPAKTFLRGFVLSYANFLHLNSEKVLETFYEEMGSTKPTPTFQGADHRQAPTQTLEPHPATNQVQPVQKTSEPVEKVVSPAASTNDAKNLESLHENQNTKTIAIAALGFVLLVLILFTNKVIDKYKREAEIKDSTLSTIGEQVQPVTSGLPQVEGSNALEVSTDDKPLVEPPITQSETTTNSTKPEPSSLPVAKLIEEKQISPTPNAPIVDLKENKAKEEGLNAKTEAKEETKENKEITKPVELIVEALDSVEVEYSAPSGKPQKIKLSAEQVHTFKSKSGLKISFSNGGAVNLILNGREIGIPGSLGKEVKLSY